MRSQTHRRFLDPTTLALCAILALAPSSHAEEAAAPDPLPAAGGPEVVTVTAARIEIPLAENPAATTVVTEEDIERTSSKTIAADEALELVPGVRVENQADGERVHLSIRGQGILTERGIRGIKVLLDGIPLNDPSGFAPDLFDVDWAAVERIEVLRGPSSALYGCGSSGGVLNIVTRGAGSAAGEAGVSTGIGSYGFGKVFAETGGEAGSAAWRVFASRATGDGYRDHTAYDATNVYGKLRLDTGPRSRVQVVAYATDFFNENAEGLNLDWLAEDRTMANPDAELYNEYQKTGRASVGMTGSFAPGEGRELSYAVHYRATRYREAVPSSVIHRTYDTPGAEVQYAFRLGGGRVRHHLAAGADLGYQSIDDLRHPNSAGGIEGSEVLSDQSITQQGGGVFAMDRIELGGEWGAMAGIRWDRIDNSLTSHVSSGETDPAGDKNFSETTGRLGVTWNPSPGLGLYASWGQGFLPPAVEELTNNPAGFTGFNEDLVPATSHGEEIGVRGSAWGRVHYDATVFHLVTEDDFGRYRVPERPLETFYRNAGSSRRYGVETLTGWYPAKGTSVQLAYTYSDFKYTSVESGSATLSGTWLPNSPKHRGYLDAERVTASGLVLGASVEAESRSYVDETNVPSIPGYGLVHLRAGVRKRAGSGDAEVLLVVRNAFDREYIAFTEPDPDGNSYQPAPTREIFLTGRFRWGIPASTMAAR